MPVRAATVEVATTATPLITGADDPMTGRSTVVKNEGAASIFVGGADVTTTAGFELAPGDSLAMDIISSDLHGICTAGTVAVSVLQVGVA